MSPNPLVVCADDYALNDGVSRGIVQLALAGRISATSVMVLSPHWLEHGADLQALRQRLGVGLHLDWTSPWARQRGHGMSLATLMLRSVLGVLDRCAIEAEIHRQLDGFEAVWGAPPDHVDGHQHIHQFPVFRQALMQVLQQRYSGAIRPWLRVSLPAQRERGFKPWLIARMGGAALQSLAREAGWPCSGALLGISDFSGDASHWLQQAQTWLAWAQGTPAAVLMCHPGLADIDATDGIAYARTQEWAAMASDRWPQMLQKQHIQLTRHPFGPVECETNITGCA
jgi:predicted glycoside hydrolase/deacetylase ChbG (UPF0249 family)